MSVLPWLVRIKLFLEPFIPLPKDLHGLICLYYVDFFSISAQYIYSTDDDPMTLILVSSSKKIYSLCLLDFQCKPVSLFLPQDASLIMYCKRNFVFSSNLLVQRRTRYGPKTYLVTFDGSTRRWVCSPRLCHNYGHYGYPNWYCHYFDPYEGNIRRTDSQEIVWKLPDIKSSELPLLEGIAFTLDAKIIVKLKQGPWAMEIKIYESNTISLLHLPVDSEFGDILYQMDAKQRMLSVVHAPYFSGQKTTVNVFLVDLEKKKTVFEQTIEVERIISGIFVVECFPNQYSLFLVSSKGIVPI
jgi:hypothetical protein